MSQKLAQVVALVTYGNLFLQDRSNDFDIDRLVTDNCYNLDFVEPPIEGIAGSSKALASDAHKWYKYLKDQGAKNLKLYYKPSKQIDLPDHISTAFVGGGSHWFIEVQFDSASDLYLSEWIPSDDKRIDRRKTHYLRFNRDMTHIDDPSFSVSKSRGKLSNVLYELIEFTRKFDYTKNWVENFTNALSTLNEFEPQQSDEFLPAGIYPKETRQLIQGVFASWVFGGMGSFNDLSFSGVDQDRYELLSNNLYSTLCNAIISGVNSYP